MNRKKTRMLRLLTAAAVCRMTAALLPLHGSAATIEDVYDAMRRIGLPESMVQEAKNQYQTTEHDDAGMNINGNYFTYDVWADMVELYEDEIWEEVGKQFGVSKDQIKEATQNPEPQTPSVEPEKPFASMSLEEKQAYIASLPEEERAAFLAGLSTADRNSIIKQMDTESKANIAEGFIGLGEQLGMHVSVDELDSNSISYSVRNSEGTLIDVSSVGNTVDNTGWDMTLPVLAASGMILLAVGGIAVITKKQEEPCNG